MSRTSVAQRELMAGIEQLADPAHMEPVHLHVPDFRSVASVILKTELALANRLGCDSDGHHSPLIAPTTGTYKALRESYQRIASGQPEELFADFELADQKDLVQAVYMLPLTVSGRRNRVVRSGVHYLAREVVAEESTTIGLVRRSWARAAIAPHPYHKPKNARSDPNQRHHDRATTMQRLNGTLGTV